jgi:uncharacterized membrane protein
MLGTVGVVNLRAGTRNENAAFGKPTMTGSIESLFLAVILFVGGHFVLGFPAIRAAMVDRIGENPFKGLFSLVSAASFTWMLLAYGAAPRVDVWPNPDWTYLIPNLALPIATILLVCGYTGSNPTAIGQEDVLRDDPRAARGIITVTRHPTLWALGLWAMSHLVSNGDAASVLLFGGLAVMSFGGMSAIDTKKRATMGAGWGPFELTTSVVPFLAIAQGRTRFDWAGIGPARLAGGLALWAILWFAHPFFIGVSPAMP